MQVSVDIPPLPLGKGDLYANTTNPMAVMPVRPETPDSAVRLTSSVTLASPLPHDLSKLSATSLITLQLAERVPLRTFYDGMFRFPCHYGMQLYIKAAEIYDRLKTGCEPGSKFNLVMEDLVFDGSEEKRLAYELAYATLKYEDVLFQTLADASFTARYPEYQHGLSLAAVILYDYQERRFQRRPPLSSDRATPAHLRRLEQALLLLRTRLSACLARLRILHDAPSLATLLPAALRPREPAPRRPVHGWINYNKCTKEEVLESLWSTLKMLQPVLTDERGFRHDEDFRDLLCFEAGWKETILKTGTCRNRWLVLQEKACCLPAYAVVQELRRLWEREPELRGSLLQVGAGSGRTLAHVLSKLPPEVRGGLDGVAVLAGERKEVLEKQLDELGVKGARVLSGSLEQPTSLRTRDLSALRGVVAAIVTPESTQTALVDPVGWVVEEGGDISLLRELSLDPSHSQLPQRVSALVTAQNDTLLRTLRLPHVRVVVYATHSANRAENEEVVFGVVDEVNEEQRRRWQAERDRNPHHKLDLEEPPDKLYELRQLMSPPPEVESERDETMTMPFIVLPQSPTSSGVFIAVIVKNVEYIRRENRSVIDTALDMGVLDGLGPPIAAAETSQTSPRRRSRRRSRRVKPAPFRSERAIADGAAKTPAAAAQSPGATASMPSAVGSPRRSKTSQQNTPPQVSPRLASPRQSLAIHVQTPHLRDCTCESCQQQRRRQRRAPSQPAPARPDGPTAARPRRGDWRRTRPTAPDGPPEGSVSSLPADSGTAEAAAPAARSQLPPVTSPQPRALSPIHGSQGNLAPPGRRSPQPVHRSLAERSSSPGFTSGTVQLAEQSETLEELNTSDDDLSRDAIRAVQQSMSDDPPYSALYIGQPQYPRNDRTLQDMRELSRLRAGLLPPPQQQSAYWWYLAGGGRPRLDPALRPHVRQLLAPTRRPAARWGVSSPEQRAQPPQMVPPYRHRAAPPAHDAGAPASAPEKAERLRLPRLQRRRDLSLGAPLPIHKVNIGDNLSGSLYSPLIF